MLHFLYFKSHVIVFLLCEEPTRALSMASAAAVSAFLSTWHSVVLAGCISMVNSQSCVLFWPSQGTSRSSQAVAAVQLIALLAQPVRQGLLPLRTWPQAKLAAQVWAQPVSWRRRSPCLKCVNFSLFRHGERWQCCSICYWTVRYSSSRHGNWLGIWCRRTDYVSWSFWIWDLLCHFS